MHWRQILLTLIADDINLVIIFNWLVIHNIFDVCSWWCCWWRRRALGLFVCNIDKDKLMTIDFSRILLSNMLHDKRILKVKIPSMPFAAKSDWSSNATLSFFTWTVLSFCSLGFDNGRSCLCSCSRSWSWFSTSGSVNGNATAGSSFSLVVLFSELPKNAGLLGSTLLPWR